MRIGMHGGNLSLLAPEFGYRPEQLLDFSVNLNPLGPPEWMAALLAEAVSDLGRYPDPTSETLRSAIAFSHGVATQGVVVANGSTELIQWLPRIMPNPRAIIFAPTFTEYARAVESAQGQVFYSLALKKESLENGLDLAFICNPNNPTGAVISKPELLSWLDDFEGHYPEAIAVVDESFLPFVPDQENISLAEETKTRPRLVVLRSLTKIFGVPGLRIGYCLSSPELADTLREIMPLWSVNAFAQKFAFRALKDLEYLKAAPKHCARLRRHLELSLGAVPEIKIYPSEVNFLLIKLTDPALGADQLVRECGRRGVVLRNCNDFYGLRPDRFVRVAVKKEEDHQVLAKTWKEVVSDVG